MSPELQEKILDAYREAREKAAEEGESPDTAKNSFGFPWKASVVAADGRVINVFERNDRPGTVRARWQATDEEVRRKQCPPRPKPTVPLHTPIRDERGRLLARAAGAATAAALAVYEDWLVEVEAEPAIASQAAPWTLERMLREYTDPQTGSVFSVGPPSAGGGRKSRWREDNIGTFPIDHSKRTHISELDRIVGLDLPVSEWDDEHEQRVIRTVAKEAPRSKGNKALRILGTVYAAANFCRKKSGFPVGACLAPKKWQAELKRTWTSLTGTDTAPSRPPYTDTEAQKLVSKLADADPRLEAAMILGLGYRNLQVAEGALRSQLTAGGPFGRQLSVVDKKKMATTTIDLTSRQQRFLDVAMESGYLSLLEAAYQRGEITDYYLVPGGRLKDGMSPVAAGTAPLGRRRLSALMTEHEAACGVRHVRGRLFHGLRRSMEKLVALETTDEAVRDLAGGWVVGGGTRPAIYTDAQDEDRRAMAATARDAAINRVSGALASAPFLNSLGLEAARIEEKAREVAREFGRTDLDRVIAAAGELREALDQAIAGGRSEPPG
ncbi:MAG: hypothetical protein AMXMBFR53_14520 [Gemmatimonadota bacterium]